MESNSQLGRAEVCLVTALGPGLPEPQSWATSAGQALAPSDSGVSSGEELNPTQNCVSRHHSAGKEKLATAEELTRLLTQHLQDGELSRTGWV